MEAFLVHEALKADGHQRTLLLAKSLEERGQSTAAAEKLENAVAEVQQQAVPDTGDYLDFKNAFSEALPEIPQQYRYDLFSAVLNDLVRLCHKGNIKAHTELMQLYEWGGGAWFGCTKWPALQNPVCYFCANSKLAGQ